MGSSFTLFRNAEKSADEGGYVVYIPALPGCVTQGDTFEEAQRMARDAVKGYLEVLKEEHSSEHSQDGRHQCGRIPSASWSLI
ncbi:MAG: type II toxin-antitoxin system HicB family antitoxin [Deltaproteobacteria bacterium]|nr:type II toxin-antitoxin system HicB family antitoxin [Deltaproteobacteria bacterium]